MLLKDFEVVLNMKSGSFYVVFGFKDVLFELVFEKYVVDGVE